MSEPLLPRPRSGLLALLFILATLSGCLGSSSSKTATSSAAAAPLFNAETGALRIQVLNDEALPIVGAEVALDNDTNLSNRTNEEGRVVFGFVPPGPHAVRALKIGFREEVRLVTAVAGEALDVPITLLKERPKGLPYAAKLEPLPGRFACARAVTVVLPLLAGPCKAVGLGGPLAPIEDAWTSATGGDRTIFDLPEAVAKNRTSDRDELKSIVVELKWVPSTDMANVMSLSLEKANDRFAPPAGNGSNPVTYGFTTGGPGLKLVVEPGTLGVGADPDTMFPANETGFTVGVFPATDASPDVSVYLNQSFTVYVTMFFNRPAPPEYTALA